MSKHYLVRDGEIERNFNENGFSMTELLAGTYSGGIKNYKCYLKAGCKVSPEKFSDKSVIFFFGKGKGYICDDLEAYNITELAFYAPDFDKVNYEIRAVEDMDFIMAVIEMNQWDWELYKANHTKLPYFRLESQCRPYVQDCKGPNTESYSVLGAKNFGRIMVGTTRAVGEGTFEKGHPAVHQWTYCVGNSDFNLRVDHGKIEKVHGGDFSFIPAGPDHDLFADPGKEVHYVWFEHFTREKDFVKTQLPEV